MISFIFKTCEESRLVHLTILKNIPFKKFINHWIRNCVNPIKFLENNEQEVYINNCIWKSRNFNNKEDISKKKKTIRTIKLNTSKKKQ